MSPNGRVASWRRNAAIVSGGSGLSAGRRRSQRSAARWRNLRYIAHSAGDPDQLTASGHGDGPEEFAIALGDGAVVAPHQRPPRLARIRIVQNRGRDRRGDIGAVPEDRHHVPDRRQLLEIAAHDRVQGVLVDPVAIVEMIAEIADHALGETLLGPPFRIDHQHAAVGVTGCRRRGRAGRDSSRTVARASESIKRVRRRRESVAFEVEREQRRDIAAHLDVGVEIDELAIAASRGTGRRSSGRSPTAAGSGWRSG